MKTSAFPLTSPFTRAEGACRSRSRGNEHGSAMVEMALSLTILLTVLLGLLSISLGLYSYHYISEAAREGTRYAIVRGSSCTGLTACPAAAADVQTYVRGLGYPGITTTSLTVTTTWPTTGVNCTPSVNPCNNPGNLVQVTVTYPFQLSIPFVPVSTIKMTSTSEMSISQ